MRLGAGVALLERSKAGSCAELLPLLVRYGLVTDCSQGGRPSFALAAADVLVCWLVAAMLGEHGVVVPLDVRLETFPYLNYNLKWIQDAAFLAQWPYLPVDDLWAIVANEEFTPWKRQMAIRALGRHLHAGRVDLRETLLALLPDECSFLGEAVIAAFAQAPAQIPVEMQLAALLRGDWSLSKAAVTIIEQLGDQAPIAVLIEALRSDELTRQQRYAVWQALEPLADHVPAEPLIALFPQADEGSQRAILDILGARAPRDLVLQAAENASAWVRMKALELLGDQASFAAILPHVEEPQFENRGFAGPLLRLFGVVGTPEQLMEVLEQSIYPEVRAAAVEALARYGQPEVRAALHSALYDVDGAVRAQALDALGLEVTQEHLLAAVADESTEVRETALCQLQVTNPVALDPVVQEAAAFLLGQGSGPVLGSLVQSSIAKAIGELERAPAGLMGHVGELLEWPHWEVQCAAANTLGMLRRNGPDRAIRRLLDLRQAAASRMVRRAADDALSEILSLETGIEDD